MAGFQSRTSDALYRRSRSEKGRSKNGSGTRTASNSMAQHASTV
ncbi:hypothetical protein EVA_15328 [gut metagenome]|uniref:Uncharacterized protein n=1 Tax=gut metagenome TaxID=749906 RepID=J9FNS5_9ZZZZ